MKVKCELCGGALQIHKGGMALCTECGLGYSMERLREMREESPSVEELVALFTRVPLNPPEELLEDDPFDDLIDGPEELPPEPPPEAPPEVPLSALLSTRKPPAQTPYEVQVKPRDKPRLELMAKAYKADSFLMLVDDVYSVGTVGADVIGTVSSGSIKPGDTVLINGECPCEVMAIEHHGLRQEYAWKDMYASILLKDVTAENLSRGDLLTAADPIGTAKPVEKPPVKELSFERELDYSDLIPLHSEQFIMDVASVSRRGAFRSWSLTVEGTVRQGCVANMDTVFLNGSRVSGWMVWGIEATPPAAYKNRASAGMKVRLTLEGEQKADPSTVKTIVGECCPPEALDRFTGTPRQFFNSLLVRQFHPKYRILTEANCPSIPHPVTYLFCEGDKPRLAVFLVDSFDNKGYYRVGKALQACEQAGLPAMQFFMDYSNTAHYVSTRIRKILERHA